MLNVDNEQNKWSDALENFVLAMVNVRKDKHAEI